MLRICMKGVRYPQDQFNTFAEMKRSFNKLCARKFLFSPVALFNQYQYYTTETLKRSENTVESVSRLFIVFNQFYLPEILDTRAMICWR